MRNGGIIEEFIIEELFKKEFSVNKLFYPNWVSSGIHLGIEEDENIGLSRPGGGEIFEAKEVSFGFFFGTNTQLDLFSNTLAFSSSLSCSNTVLLIAFSL